jgi:hypothetical protein
MNNSEGFYPAFSKVSLVLDIDRISA